MSTAQKKALVVGAGQMGSGIAQVLATYGWIVRLVDTEEKQLERGKKRIEESVRKLQEKGSLPDDKAHILSRLSFFSSLDAAFQDDAEMRSVSLVVEAIVEHKEAKRALFSELAARFPAETILASNTSSISITELASDLPHPERVIGMHFMNPVPLMPLVEVIASPLTAEAVVEQVMGMARELRKTPVKVNDFPGFVSNRVLMPMINEAIFAVYEGVASVEAVDQVMTLGMRHPMGPLKLADFIGLDTCLYIMNVLYEGLGDPKYRPCPLLKQYVAAGRLGVKSGRGFYVYDDHAR
ncbi:MAG: 3-hydroxybutyryl-CoA dehydrogenase [Candidatus Carbobacillus altaicus]|uniref:3-hydroxybutyryl-CoA dehydrogenase n=1 Tax=Candidatus Carbonibacillus altaicus TaxID=2163959 RepID=A0A2R6Y456_9BACL|nr:MAG: 3-hydroxybutyryl-CoA dehydrogenase [Candidatus Carbobacillus altaicus]